MTRPDWTRAACRHYPDPEDFDFDEDRGDLVPDTLIMLCHGCPIRDDCFDWASRWREFGIWAATTRNQRRRIREGGHRRNCPACNAPAPFRRDDGQVCGFCGMSWHVKPGKTPDPSVSEV